MGKGLEATPPDAFQDSMNRPGSREPSPHQTAEQRHPADEAEIKAGLHQENTVRSYEPFDA